MLSAKKPQAVAFFEFRPKGQIDSTYNQGDKWNAFNHKEHPATMIPGSIGLGFGCLLSPLADAVRDTALAILNLSGIIITLGTTSRSNGFKRNFCRHVKNVGDDMTIVAKLSWRVVADIGVNLLFGSAYQVFKAGKLITKLYFEVLDKTLLANFYSDQPMNHL